MGRDDITLNSAPIRDDGVKLSDRVAIELGSQIVRAELPEGARLPTEAELCDVYRVSRSVIRDAIRTLSARGLVEVSQGHGMVVAHSSDAPFAEALIILLMRSSLTLGHVLEARVVIETELAPLAVEHGTENDWRALRSDLGDYAAAVDSSDWPAAQAAHAAFHYSLLESIHLRALRLMLRPMQQIILLSSVPPTVGSVDGAQVWTPEDVAVHYPILEALEARDKEAVSAAMKAHFGVARRNELVASHSQTPFRESQAAQLLLREMLTARRPSDESTR